MTPTLFCPVCQDAKLPEADEGTLKIAGHFGANNRQQSNDDVG